MKSNAAHYRRTVAARETTHLARCGYSDRFDPLALSALPRLRLLYESLFAEFLGEAPFDRVLDAGCGTGLYFECLAPHARNLNALDVSREMLSAAREFSMMRGIEQVRVGVGSFEALPYPDETFDLVVALDALHHVENVNAAIAEAWRVLTPGGHFFVFEPNILNPLMLAAHALPAEERLALARSRPGALRALLEARFETLRWRGVCALITETKGFRRRLLDAFVGACRMTRCETLYPRQAWLGVKRA